MFTRILAKTGVFLTILCEFISSSARRHERELNAVFKRCLRRSFLGFLQMFAHSNYFYHQLTFLIYASFYLICYCFWEMEGKVECPLLWKIGHCKCSLWVSVPLFFSHVVTWYGDVHNVFSFPHFRCGRKCCHCTPWCSHEPSRRYSSSTVNTINNKSYIFLYWFEYTVMCRGVIQENLMQTMPKKFHFHQ